ncbi:MAG: hypothetical protein IJX28_09375 [Clostridia bacterium]|nr:hypothetical protein [Clostridia bacterium]
MMELSLFDATRKKKALKSYGILILILTVFYAAVCTPVNLWITSDILIMQTVFPLLWDVLLNFVNILFYWISFAYLLFLFAFWGVKKQFAFFLTYGGIVVFRYCANLLASYCVVGFPEWEVFWSDALPYLLIDIGMDLVQMLIGVWIVYSYVNCRKNTKDGLPIQKLFDATNPILRVVWKLAIIPAALMLLSRVIYDIYLGGAYGLTDLLWMITYYASDLISVLVGYFVILLFMNRFYLKEEEAKIEYDSSHLL